MGLNSVLECNCSLHTFDFCFFFLVLCCLSSQVFFRFEPVVLTSFFFRRALLNKSFDGLVFVVAAHGSSKGLVHALILSSICFPRISSVLSTSTVHSGKSAARYAKSRNLWDINLKRSIASILGSAIIFLPWLSRIVPARACRVHRFNMYCGGSDLIFIMSRTLKA